MTYTRIEGPAAWTGAELSRRTDWIHHLTGEEIADIERVVAVVRRSGKARDQLTQSDVAFEALAPALSAWRETLAHGRGFLLVRGLPVDRLSHDDAVAAYWALGLHVVILHKRTAYEDWDEPHRKRHLLRLWLAAPDFDDGDEQLRQGVALS